MIDVARAVVWVGGRPERWLELDLLLVPLVLGLRIPVGRRMAEPDVGPGNLVVLSRVVSGAEDGGLFLPFHQP